MVKYKMLGDKLAVKGMNSGLAVGLCIFVFILLITTLSTTVLLIKANSETGPLVVFVILFFIILIAQVVMGVGCLKLRKRVVVFDKSNGLVVFRSGDKYKEINIGKALHWNCQQVLHKNHKGSIHQYHAVIIGNKGKAYIGLSGMSKRSLTTKLKRLNEYYKLELKVSSNILSSIEVISEQKRWGCV